MCKMHFKMDSRWHILVRQCLVPRGKVQDHVSGVTCLLNMLCQDYYHIADFVVVYES